METAARPLRRNDLEPIKRSDGQVLYDPVTRAVHSLDATSMAIWEACDGETTVRELSAAIAELGGMEASASGSLVQAALSELRDAGLIEYS